MSATHLCVLQTYKSTYRIAQLKYYSEVLRGLRIALSKTPTLEESEAIVSCSFLLLQYSWTYFDPPTLPGKNGDLDLGMSSIWSISSGIKQVNESRYKTVRQNYFYKTSAQKLREAVVKLSSNPVAFTELESLFAHCCSCPLMSRACSNPRPEFLDAAQRLIWPLCLLRLDANELNPADSAEVSYYLFLWPVLCARDFELELLNGDQRPLVILLYYSMAVSKLLSQEYWWARERARFLFETLLFRLNANGCTECTGWAWDIYHGEKQYFNAYYPAHTAVTPSIPAPLFCSPERQAVTLMACTELL
jgi:hypothetical protein